MQIMIVYALIFGVLPLQTFLKFSPTIIDWDLPRRFCGSELANLVGQVCRHHYQEQPDNDAKEMNTKPVEYTKQDSIATECCKIPCSPKMLKVYCSTEEQETGTEHVLYLQRGFHKTSKYIAPYDATTESEPIVTESKTTNTNFGIPLIVNYTTTTTKTSNIIDEGPSNSTVIQTMTDAMIMEQNETTTKTPFPSTSYNETTTNNSTTSTKLEKGDQ